MNTIRLHNLLFFGCIFLLIHGITRSATSAPLKDSLLGVSPEGGFASSLSLSCPFCRIFSLLCVNVCIVYPKWCVQKVRLKTGCGADEIYYKGFSSSSAIKCKDGSKKFNKSQLNDDFCDCPDGSDEPGTSACPNGKFYCKNTGHAPVILYSSRVNDGICGKHALLLTLLFEMMATIVLRAFQTFVVQRSCAFERGLLLLAYCCDGSDEYDGKTKCVNTCWEAGRVAREKLKKKIATYQEGVTIRRQEIEQAKLGIAKEEGELLKLKDQEKILKELVEKLKERKEQIEKAEEKERLQKEKEEKERKEAEEPKENEIKAEVSESMQNDNIGTVDQPHRRVFNNYGRKLNLGLQDSAEDHHESANEPELSDHSVEDRLPNDGVEVNEGPVQKTEQLGEESTFDDKTGLDTGNQDDNIAEDTESLSREELGRRVASRWTGEKTEQHEEFDASIDKDHQNPDETPNETNDEENNGYVSEYDDHKYDDDDSEDQVDDFGGRIIMIQVLLKHPSLMMSQTYITGTSGSSLLEKIQKTVKSIFQAVNLFQTPVNITEAAHVRKEYDESSAKLSKIQSRISSLRQKLKQDFGPEKEFYSFYGQCFESKQNKYVYKVCPFKEASQVEGYSTTRLGSWEKFEDSYRFMQFLNGDKCWNGPDRSIKVKLRCGLKNELTDVDEPSRCEYLALLSTPALCLDSRLKVAFQATLF
ncbi:hypothetical protein DH2020_021872 [Rehmannia glutinosa]|uniref:Glucosidase 2 subunit beta n=1 Tax=Rehmannia glutinosa TaxID=99300 RepID=A0ABR0WBQ5_REHGL